ncbi:hypothetical protein DIPPA_30646 [Diplonema papillatum]|nr:hypothetical protein DIPPA_30646 [Diplonema papillatum]
MLCLAVNAAAYQQSLLDVFSTISGNASNSMRAYAVVASAALAERFADDPAGAVEWNATGTLTLASHGDLSKQIEGGQRAYRMDVDSSDSIIAGLSRAIRSLPGGYERVSANASAEYIELPKGGYYTMVTPMTTRVPGFHHHFVMALPIAFLMGTAQATLEREIATNARERSRLNDRIASDLNTTGIVVAACALVVAFAMVIMSTAMLRPLQQLRQDMESVAEMRLDADPEIPGVYELQLIASSFRTMIRNLREFKAYVPRSVLNSSCDDIVFNVASPAGNVTLVFTDIQNSTALWEKSPADMDHALEQHNEVCFRNCQLTQV